MCRRASLCTFRPTFTGFPGRIADLKLLFQIRKRARKHTVLEENKVYCIFLIFLLKVLIQVIGKTTKVFFKTTFQSNVQYKQK